MCAQVLAGAQPAVQLHVGAPGAGTDTATDVGLLCGLTGCKRGGGKEGV
jgi:hypothetical protein